MSDDMSAVTYALMRTYREVNEYIRRDESELKAAQESVKRYSEQVARNKERLTELQEHGLANGLDIESAYQEQIHAY